MKNEVESILREHTQMTNEVESILRELTYTNEEFYYMGTAFISDKHK